MDRFVLLFYNYKLVVGSDGINYTFESIKL